MKGKFRLRLGAGCMLFALTLFAYKPANAQVSLSVGAIGGPAFTNISSDIGTYKGIMSGHFGLASEMGFGSLFSMELDVLLSPQGAQRNYIDSLVVPGYYKKYYVYNTLDHFMYVGAPLLFKLNIPLVSKGILPYDVPNNHPSSISIYAGPFFNHMLSYSRSGNIRYTNYDISGSDPVLISDRTVISSPADSEVAGIFKNDFGLTAGIGVNLNIMDGKAVLGIDARGSKGFNPIDYGYYGRYNLKTDSNTGEPVSIGYQYAKNYNVYAELLVSFKYRIMGE